VLALGPGIMQAPPSDVELLPAVDPVGTQVGHRHTVGTAPTRVNQAVCRNRYARDHRAAKPTISCGAREDGWSPLDGESEVGRFRSVDRTDLLQLDPPAAEIVEKSGAVPEQDGDDVDLHLIQ
jgi:hypothetical protein